jgi:hypothetical protein
VQARVNGTVCGQGRTQLINDQVVYSVDVAADGPGEVANCGAPGRTVTFQVGSQMMGTTANWNNDRPHELAVGGSGQQGGDQLEFYLPLVAR